MKHYVYWLKLPEHKDPFSQGYIGISEHLIDRITKHKRGLYKEYENIIVEVLWECITLDDSLIIERMFRPLPFIGWNKHRGGTKPSHETNVRAGKIGGRCNKGKKHSDESKVIYSIAAKNTVHHAAWNDNVRKALLGVKHPKWSCLCCKNELSSRQVKRHHTLCIERNK